LAITHPHIPWHSFFAAAMGQFLPHKQEPTINGGVDGVSDYLKNFPT